MDYKALTILLVATYSAGFATPQLVALARAFGRSLAGALKGVKAIDFRIIYRRDDDDGPDTSPKNWSDLNVRIGLPETS